MKRAERGGYDTEYARGGGGGVDGHNRIDAAIFSAQADIAPGCVAIQVNNHHFPESEVEGRSKSYRRIVIMDESPYYAPEKILHFIMTNHDFGPKNSYYFIGRNA